MNPSFVTSMAYSLGDERHALQDSAAVGRLQSPIADLATAGFAWHHVCAPQQTSYDLARAAVSSLPLPETVDAIIYSTCLPHNGNAGDVAAWSASRDVKHLMDFPASKLQSDLELHSAAVFGLTQQGCTGLLGSLRLANSLLASEPDWRTVLCVTADRFPEEAVYEQSYNVISDGAAACLVSADPGRFRVVASHQITNGGLHAASNDETVGLFFSYIPNLVRQTLDRASLSIADIDWVVPQNTNHTAWTIAARLLGIDADRVCQPTLGEVGHAISADNVINLSALLDTGALRPGQHVLLVMAGHGLNWQATVLQATEHIG
ncbi:3-oxoacyl-[acyl-carrier-protein] synthase III C-terminal domain-containing protein [Streptomyces mirabilis]|uniref:3-oxoacyl-[acyl-carrier-protein] synthase III C-terminal domain-containing protein n=1 Tax=Streptomyces mirabilis TaxID=68239 RepID=UPI00332A164E